jgi:hypothetical protein
MPHFIENLKSNGINDCLKVIRVIVTVRLTLYLLWHAGRQNSPAVLNMAYAYELFELVLSSFLQTSATAFTRVIWQLSRITCQNWVMKLGVTMNFHFANETSVEVDLKLKWHNGYAWRN